MVERIGPEEAKRRMENEGYVYVDVRSVAEFEQGHPEGAYNVPLLLMTSNGLTPNSEFVGVMERAFGRDVKLVLGCKTGGRSLRAAEMLSATGFGTVVDQRAGWAGGRDPFGRLREQGWSGAQLPASRTALAGRSYRELESSRAQGDTQRPSAT